MKLLLLILVLVIPCAPTHAAYVVAPDIAKEYLELRVQAQQHPDDPALQFEYAICLSYLGSIEEGGAALKRVRALDGGFAKKALPLYLKKLQAQPADPKLKYRLGFLYYFNEDYEQALQVLTDVAKQEPVAQLNAWALGYMAVIKGKQKKWDEAETLVRRALAIEPDAYGLHAALAGALKERGNYFAAVGAYLTALEERRKFEEYLKTLVESEATTLPAKP